MPNAAMITTATVIAIGCGATALGLDLSSRLLSSHIDYAYGGECYWLRQQAYATGSPYWWSRYNACIGYY